MEHTEFQPEDKSIYRHDIVYRPIVEEDCILLEVATGCSYHRCAFCDFARDKFEWIPMEEIRQSAEILGQREPDKKELFLLGQNALALPTEKLLEILGYVHTYLPNVEEIKLYGRADDVLRHGAVGLARLRAAGLDVVHLGLESGSDAVLQRMKKGVSAAEILAALQALEAAGIHYHISYILGLGGQGLWREHISGTAVLLSKIKPLTIWALALKIWPKTPLHEEVMLGQFAPQSYEQMLAEERWILANAQFVECLYMDTTALGKYTLLGVLPDSQDDLLMKMDLLLAPYDVAEILNYTP
ncbi:MAG: radical SAM protein [Oscillospiraceae bacterium]